MIEDYADRLKAALEYAGMNETSLAKALKISYQAVKRVTDGKTKAFSAPNHEEAARILGVSGRWLALNEGADLRLFPLIHVPVRKGVNDARVKGFGRPFVARGSVGLHPAQEERDLLLADCAVSQDALYKADQFVDLTHFDRCGSVERLERLALFVQPLRCQPCCSFL